MNVIVPVPPSPCPSCRRLLWDDAPEKQVTPGDFVICAFCKRPATVDEDMALRALTFDEFRELLGIIQRQMRGTQ